MIERERKKGIIKWRLLVSAQIGGRKIGRDDDTNRKRKEKRRGKKITVRIS